MVAISEFGEYLQVNVTEVSSDLNQWLEKYGRKKRQLFYLSCAKSSLRLLSVISDPLIVGDEREISSIDVRFETGLLFIG